MTPGVLDRRLDVTPIKRVSPSRYEAMVQCALREVWAAGGQPHLLPLSPAARLGTAVHQLLEEAGRGRLTPAERPVVERRWEELVRQAESAMLMSWLERVFVPLRSSVPDFEVRGLRAQERVLAIAQAVASARREPQERVAAGFERWVAVPDGSVGGYIDHVVETPDGPVLRDYKSGGIHEAAAGVPPVAVRPSFVVQLRLYAALYAGTTGTWPARLELVPLLGEAVGIPFDTATCEALLADAIAALARINATIAEAASRQEEPEGRLAAPGVTTCRHCLFRPACVPYRRVRTGATGEEAWPQDVWGELREIRQLGNRKLLLTVATGSAGAEVRCIRGITANPARHPALQHLREGNMVGVFGLRGSAGGGTLSEALWTVVYKMECKEDG